MRFKLDENLPAETASLLTGAGRETVSVLDQGMGGSDDARLSEVCRDEVRVLLTLDLDFGDIRTYPPGEYSGIIVLRLARQGRERVLSAVRTILPLLEQEELAGRLWIVDEQRVRVRGGQ